MFQIACILVCLLLFNILQWNLELDGEEGFDTGYYQIQVMQGMKTGNKSLLMVYKILQRKTGIIWNSIIFPAELLVYLASFSLFCFPGTTGYAKKRANYPTRKPHKKLLNICQTGKLIEEQNESVKTKLGLARNG